MNTNDLKKKFTENWEKNKKTFGKKEWKAHPDFLYFIEISLPKEHWEDFEEKDQELKKNISIQTGIWFPPSRMHITLALPARDGFHFQGNDEGRMKTILEKILKDVPPIKIQIGDVNCFPDALFYEVYDTEGSLLSLHKKIQKEIPFSQAPQFGGENYLPHMTIFYGTGSTDVAELEKIRIGKKIEIEATSIIFGRAKNDAGRYERQILKEFTLKG